MTVVAGVVEHRPEMTFFRDFFRGRVALLVQQALKLVDTALGRAVVELHFLADRVLLGHEALPAGACVIFGVVRGVKLQLRDVFFGSSWRRPRSRERGLFERLMYGGCNLHVVFDECVCDTGRWRKMNSSDS